MSGINKVILIGHVGKEPEIRHVSNGRAVNKFSLATTERYKNKAGERVEKTEWHNITLWTPLAEIVDKYVRKGSKLYIEGRLRTHSYEDDAGAKRYFTEVEARELVMLDTKADSGGVAPPDESASTTSQQAPPPVADEADNLPF